MANRWGSWLTTREKFSYGDYNSKDPKVVECREAIKKHRHKRHSQSIADVKGKRLARETEIGKFGGKTELY